MPALPERAEIPIFDEEISNSDWPTVELFAKTLNQFRGNLMMIITHQITRRLQVAKVFSFDNQQHATKVELVGEEK